MATKRGLSQASIRAAEKLAARKKLPSTKREVEAFAARAGVHWTTVYRLMAVLQAQQK